jgi:hypothetical protein
VLFVSHSVQLLQELCSRALWFEHGRLVHDGPATHVATAYVQSAWDQTEQHSLTRNRARAARLASTVATGRYALGGGQLRIRSVQLLDGQGCERAVFANGEPLHLRAHWEGEAPGGQVYPAFRIDTDLHYGVAGFVGRDPSYFLNAGRPLHGQGACELQIPALHLGQGTYHVSCALWRWQVPQDNEHLLHYLERQVEFSVRASSGRAPVALYEPPVVFQDLGAIHAAA